MTSLKRGTPDALWPADDRKIDNKAKAKELSFADKTMTGRICRIGGVNLTYIYYAIRLLPPLIRVYFFIFVSVNKMLFTRMDVGH